MASNPFGDAERHKPPPDMAPKPATVSNPFGDSDRHKPPADMPASLSSVDSFFSNPQRHFKPPEPKAPKQAGLDEVANLPAAARGGSQASVATKMELMEMLNKSIESCDQTISGMEDAIQTLKANIAREMVQRARMQHLLNTVRTEILTTTQSE